MPELRAKRLEQARIDETVRGVTDATRAVGQIGRVFRLLRILVVEPRYHTLTALAARLDVSTRTVWRDIALLHGAGFTIDRDYQFGTNAVMFQLAAQSLGAAALAARRAS